MEPLYYRHHCWGGIGDKEVSLQKFFVHFYVAGTTGSVLIRDVPLY